MFSLQTDAVHLMKALLHEHDQLMHCLLICSCTSVDYHLFLHFCGLGDYVLNTAIHQSCQTSATPVKTTMMILNMVFEEQDDPHPTNIVTPVCLLQH
jgi:hypothetical protein